MRFYIIGIDDNQMQHFNPEIAEVITRNSIFSGGTRHHEIVKPQLPDNYRWIEIAVPLKDVFEQYRAYDELVVFASGDPLFFGFANTIQRELPEAEIVLYPFFNSLQLLAHRLLMPYQDMHIVSLTGRPWDKFDEALINGYAKIGLLTDNKAHTPSAIARRMLAYGYDNYRMCVGELLGNKEKERVTVCTLNEAANRDFHYPNNLILTKTQTRRRPFGIPEEEFDLLNGRTKMITKMPVRLLSLSLLDLRDKQVLWDVGFCTGSVSVEAKLQFPHLTVCAFEKREEGRMLMASNSRKFGTPGIQAYITDFTEINSADYPAPDAVFIGGHGGKMNEIIEKVAEVLHPEGLIVFNSVSEESRSLFIDSLNAVGYALWQEIKIKTDNFNTIVVMKGGRR